MSILQSATHAAILGGTHVAAAAGSAVSANHGGRTEFGIAFQKLSAAAAHTALHDSPTRSDAPRCYENTRTRYLDNLELWMLGEGGDYDGNRLIWLHGGAGVGKSAIIQSIVERCARHTVVLGTFFFSRKDISRNSAKALIPTLAYQMACAFPEAMEILEPLIHSDSLIFTASIRTQAYELIVRPILHLIDTGVITRSAKPRGVFVIDGLDECSRPRTQALVIDAIASALGEHRIPIRFLIASRFEVAISDAFQKASATHQGYASISLDHDYEATTDIRHFIADSFQHIIRTHPLRADIPQNWPDPETIDELTWNSSGLFIYAATVMKFIASPDEHPARALQVVEGLELSRMENASGDLGALYMRVLKSSTYSSTLHGAQGPTNHRTMNDASLMEIFLFILGLVIISVVTVIVVAKAAVSIERPSKIKRR